MHGGHDMNLHIPRPDEVAYIRSFGELPRQPTFLESRWHSHADQLRFAPLRQFDRIAEVIAMRMSDENIAGAIAG